MAEKKQNNLVYGLIGLAVIALCCAGGVFAATRGGNDDATISRASFEQDGRTWPFVADQADIDCTNQAVVVTIDGVRYAANGTARSLPGVQPLDDDTAAWADHPDIDGAKVPLSDVIDHGLSLC